MRSQQPSPNFDKIDLPPLYLSRVLDEDARQAVEGYVRRRRP